MRLAHSTRTEIIERWRNGSAPDLRLLLASVPPESEGAWREALVLDAQSRADRGMRPTLSHYLGLFPWIKAGSSLVQELLTIELTASVRAGASVVESVLVARYGEAFRPVIHTVLAQIDALDQAAVERPELTAGLLLGRREDPSRYELRRRLGRGSFGQVWQARDRKLDRYVALKLIEPTGDLRRRKDSLMAEARAASALRHPNVVGVQEFGQFAPPHDWLYIDMELCGDSTPSIEDPKAIAVGASLGAHFGWQRQVVSALSSEGDGEYQVDFTRVARVMADICRGVVAAHALGVVHCDLKPANVLVTPSGRAMVADFGLSSPSIVTLPKIAGSSGPHASGSQASSASAEGRPIRGTPAYMSPEQARGEEVRPVSDVYSMGAILYWMLSGRDPHGTEDIAKSPEVMATSATQSISEQGPDSITTLLRRIADPADRAAPLPRAVHPTLKRICAKAMEKDPVVRYQSASAMLADLEALLADEIPPTVGLDAPLQPLVLWLRRNAIPVVAGALLLLGLGALTAGALQQVSQLSLNLKRAEDKIEELQKALEQEKARAERLAREVSESSQSK